MVHTTAVLATSCFQNPKGEAQGVLCYYYFAFCFKNLLIVDPLSMVGFFFFLKGWCLHYWNVIITEATVKAAQGFYN